MEYAKKNEKGEFALVDKLREALNNPEENHELILHLTDKNIFKDIFKIKASQTTAREIKVLATGASKKGNRVTHKGRVVEEETPWLKNANQFNEKYKN